MFDDDVLVIAGSPGDSGLAKTPARPSILRAHNRSSSSGQGSSTGYRSLRFDSSSRGGSTGGKDREGGMANLRSSGSIASLKPQSKASKVSGDGNGGATLDEPEPGGDDEDDAEHDYGRPIPRPDQDPIDNMDIDEAKLLTALRLRERASSFNSSQGSLSPILVDGNTAKSAEFPFSINRPPSVSLDDPSNPSSQAHLLRVPSPVDNRGRGDSVSSTSTTDSRGHPSLSASGTTSRSGGSVTVTTPLLSPGRDGSFGISPSSSPQRKSEFLEHATAAAELERPQDGGYADGLRVHTHTSAEPGTSLSERRTHTPIEININSISSHAQAEALVQQAQRDILDMAYVMEVSPPENGRTPLSAKLAAYGESLALERKLREQKEADEGTKGREKEGSPSSAASRMQQKQGRREGVERQHSLGEKVPSPKPRLKEPRRPSTAEGRESLVLGIC